MCFDELAGDHALDFVDLVGPACKTNGFWILFVGFDNQILFTPRTFGAGAFGETPESHNFSCDFHIVDVYLLIIKFDKLLK